MEASMTSINATFDLLPDETAFQILLSLAPKEVGLGSFVCKRWNRLLNDPLIWQAISCKINFAIKTKF